MTINETGFLDMIRAVPGDRTTRLVYADWLENRNDSRHELIRVCEAMREVPVWSDFYWELKARRNELWTGYPLEWLEATGYDGSYYDPVFRDGVPDGWRERWRLVREFTERWHGVGVGDVGNRREVVRQAEERLGLELPPSVQEFIAYAHDLGCAGTPAYDRTRSVSLFHCAGYYLEHLTSHPAVSVISYSLDDSVLGVAHEDLNEPDPRTFSYSQWYDDVEYEPSGAAFPTSPGPEFFTASLSLSIFLNLLTELPTAGKMRTTPENPDEFLTRLGVDFPIHARFDDVEVYEADELLVVVGGHRIRGGRSERPVTAIVRRPIPIESVPEYLFGTDDRGTMSSGMLGPAWFRQQQEEQHRRPGASLPPAWRSVLRRREADLKDL